MTSTPPLPHVEVSGLAPRSGAEPALPSPSCNLCLQSPAQYTNKQTSCSAHAKVNCGTGSSSTPAAGLLSSASSYGTEAVRPNNLRFSRPFHASSLERLSHRSSVTQLTHMAHYVNSTFPSTEEHTTLTYLHAATPPMPLLMSKLSESRVLGDSNG